MLKLKYTKQFKKDIKKFEHLRDHMLSLKTVIECLIKLQPLEPKYCDHSLSGFWEHHKECHVNPDLLLIYTLNKMNNSLFLERLGSHSELFK